MKIPSKQYVQACCGEHMNLLLRRLQAEIGVTTGDVAGQFFTGANDDRWLKIAKDWTDMLCEYLEREAMYAKE